MFSLSFLTMNRFYFQFSLYSKFNNKQWVFFCEDATEIYLKGLLEVLAKFDSSKVNLQLFYFDCMLLSCHVRVSE